MRETHYEKILKALVRKPKSGLSNREGYMYSNCPWKRIKELEDKGVKIIRFYDSEDPRLRRYRLEDPKQDKVLELLAYYSKRRAS